MAKDKTKAGGFRETPLDGSGTPRSSPPQEQGLEFSDSLVNMYTAFKDQVYNPKSVLYPSCGFDASPSKVFDNVTFVDIEDGNQGCVKKLQEAGLHAVNQDIREYKPAEKHDLLILENPSIPTEWASRHLKSGGYVLANNYHGNASWMNKHSDEFSLVGLINSVNDEAKIERNKNGDLGAVLPLESIRESRPLHHLMFIHSLKTGYDEGLPFKREAEIYIFTKK